MRRNSYTNIKDLSAPGLAEANVGLVEAEYAHPVEAIGLEIPSSLGSSELSEIREGSIPCMSYALTAACLPLLPLMGCGFYTVDARTESAILHMGVLTSMQSEPGVHCTIPCGQEIRTVSVKQNAMELPMAKVADANGNPVNVSAILNYRVVDAKKALLNIEDSQKFINMNAQAVLKQIVSSYTYDQLKGDHDMVNGQMRQMLQPLLITAGVEIGSMSLNDLAYAPEVAAAMLKRQQAKALVDARTLIVEGAVRIAQDAIIKLEEEGTVQMDDDQKVKIVTNLLTVTCSDSDATPTVSLS